MLRLYHFHCPFRRKVRLVLAEKKMDVELIGRYWEQSTEFLRRNPAGESPSCDTRALLTESTPICEYIEDLNPEPPLIPKS